MTDVHGNAVRCSVERDLKKNLQRDIVFSFALISNSFCVDLIIEWRHCGTVDSISDAEITCVLFQSGITFFQSSVSSCYLSKAVSLVFFAFNVGRMKK